MLRKTKQQIIDLRKKNENLEIALEAAKVRASALQEELQNYKREATEEAVAQQLRNAIARKCEKVGINTVYHPEASAFDIWALVMAYNCFVDAAAKRVNHD